MVTVNFSETSNSDFDVIPAGKYHAKVTSGEMKESGPNANNPGAQYINWEFTIQEGTQEGRKVWTNTSLLPHALFTLKNLLSAVGLETSGSLDFEINDVLTNDCILTVGHRDFNGEARAEVKRFAPYDASKFEANQQAQLLP